MYEEGAKRGHALWVGRWTHKSRKGTWKVSQIVEKGKIRKYKERAMFSCFPRQQLKKIGKGLLSGGSAAYAKSARGGVTKQR